MLGFFSKKSKITDLSWLEIDVHAHVLPGLDVATADVTAALLYIKGLSALGFRKLICTPIRPVVEDSQSNTRIDSAFLLLKDAVKAASIDMDLILAGEYPIGPNFEVTASMSALNRRFVLISILDAAFYSKLTQAVFDLSIRNYRPILAHPEKYPFLTKDRKKLKRLKHKGCLLQLDLLSITGHYGKEVKSAALGLLKGNLYDLAGTNLQHIDELQVLDNSTQNGNIGEIIGSYPFKNRELFSVQIAAQQL